METLLLYGLPALFVASFLAGSLVPFPSEAALIALLDAGSDPAATVLVASTGNFLGAVTLYVLGRRIASGKRARSAALRVTRSPERLESSLRKARRWGAPVLLLSWLPIVGDVLVLASGMVGIRSLPFAAFTAGGKLFRFAAVAHVALAASA